MRVLFSCRPAYGHVYPVMPLASALRDKGHEVAFATGEDFQARIERLGFSSHVSGPSIGWAEDEARRALGQHERAARLSDEDRLRIGALMFGDLMPRRVLAELTPLLADLRPDLLVYDGSDLGAALAAACTGVTAVRHALGPYEFPERLVAELRSLLDGVQRERGGVVRSVDPFDADASLDISPPALRVGGGGSAGNRIPLRPVAWNEPGAPVPQEFLEGGRRPRAYITLGTVVFEAVDVIRAAVDSLVEVGAEVLVAVGPEGDPDALGPVPDLVHVERFVDQAAVLDHVDLVVSHAGSGTLLAALARGVPQLALPQGADQFGNAACLVGSGAGLQLLPHEITPAAVAGAVGALLAEPTYRDAAARVREEIAHMPAPADVIPALADLTRGRVPAP
ncbi:glycosyltransferase [soil metagenome]